MSSTNAPAPAPLARPPYEALDGAGMPYIRKAQLIHELPTPQERLEALAAATASIGQMLGATPRQRIPFGAPVYTAFMEYREAKLHPEGVMLFKRGDELPLSLCPGLYLPADEAGR